MADPLFQFGDSNCYFGDDTTGFGIGVSIFYGPDRGFKTVSAAAISTPRAIKISDRDGLIYNDGVFGCSIVLDFGTDQTILLADTASNGTIDVCDAVTTLAERALTKLPPS